MWYRYSLTSSRNRILAFGIGIDVGAGEAVKHGQVTPDEHPGGRALDVEARCGSQVISPVSSPKSAERKEEKRGSTSGVFGGR